MSISVRLDDQTRGKPVLGGQIVFPNCPGRAAQAAHLVGRGGLEPPTSRLSGVRSNHLSYRPTCRSGCAGQNDPGDRSEACAEGASPRVTQPKSLVEPIGIEPMTLCLQSRCSPS